MDILFTIIGIIVFILILRSDISSEDFDRKVPQDSDE